MPRQIMVVNLADILAFRFRCENCGDSIVRKMPGGRERVPENQQPINSMPDQCPTCLEQWPRRQSNRMDPSVNWLLMSAIKNVLESESPMTIEFEVEVREAFPRDG